MHRLRDLSRRQVVVGIAMVVALVAPFVVSILRARSVHWLPSGDDALIGLRSWDVFSSHRPLIGQGSTTHLYGHDGGTSHPGPIQFYVLALPIRILGPAAGMILGSAAVNLGAVLVAAWAVFRRAGAGVAAWAMVLLSLVLWSEGTAILTDPISSNAGGIPLLALAAVAWAVVDGDVRLLPLGALVGSWVAQQHLAIVVPSATLVAYASAGVVVIVLARRRRRATDPDAAFDPRRLWPWVTGALVLSPVLWSPVLWQQATGHPGNLTAVAEYARTSDSPTLGWMAAARQAVRTVGFPPLLVRSDLTGRSFSVGPLNPFEVLVGLGTYALLVATVVVAWGRGRALALLALTALVLAVAGTCNGSTIPNSVEAYRINFYRWEFVVAWLAWIVLGWGGALAVRSILARRGQPVPSVLPRLAPALALVLIAISTFANVATQGVDDDRRDQDGFVAMRTMSDAAIDAADDAGADRVTLLLRGRAAVLSTGQALALQLEAAGYDVQVPEQEARFWGTRVLHEGEDPGDLVLVLASGRGTPADTPGETIARYDVNTDLRDLVAPLVAQAKAGTPVPSADAEDLLAASYGGAARDYARGALAKIDRSPEPILTDPGLLRLIADGYFEEPAFDRHLVRQLLSALPARTVNDDDVFELRVLPPGDLAATIPSWKED
ncbi:MAG: hypothetical protein ACTHN0_06055 [Aquihabitans sp.]